MPFNSPGFLLLLSVTIPLYYLVRGERWQHTVLFASSFAFYWFAGVRDLVLLLATVGVNFLLTIVTDRGSRARVAGAVVMNLAVLAYFKYAGFLGRMLAPEHDWRGFEHSIPLGISFYIFQLIAYQVDLFRGHVTREGSFGRLLLYVLFFPHHQAGPIMRPAVFLPQFRGTKALDLDAVGAGCRWTLYGLMQKVIADRIGEHVDVLFASDPASAVEAWAATLGFGVQIYGDFAGYSNIAVGVALMLGYRLDRNFNQPYLACDPSVFWQRWHITLSQWLRDYLYIPLGGNRKGAVRTYLNLLITMTLGGLWHGASWNFVLWGAMHGVLLCAFRLFPLQNTSRLAGWILCQLGVFLCWVPFRAPDFQASKTIFLAMAGVGVGPGALSQWQLLLAGAVLFIGLHRLEDLVTGTPERLERARAGWECVPSFVRGGVGGMVALLCLVLLRDGTTFIYFRF